MGKIFYIVGKSCSGKDTIYRRLLKEGAGEKALFTAVPYTTRPMRDGERNGREYFFTDEAGLEKLRAQGKVIEERKYMTWYGPWYYFTADDGQIDLNGKNYVMIGTLESYEKMREYYGAEQLVPIYIEVEDGERLARALQRERSQAEPKYAEMCRRFLADTKDFSEENLKRLGIGKRFYNQEKEKCLEEIIGEIRYGKL